MDRQYRFTFTKGLGWWDVSHEDRGLVGFVRESDRQRFIAGGYVDDADVVIGSCPTLKAAVEQVIWYDRAMNQEAE